MGRGVRGIRGYGGVIGKEECEDKWGEYMEKIVEWWEGMGDMVKSLVELLGVEKGKEEGGV